MSRSRRRRAPFRPRPLTAAVTGAAVVAVAVRAAANGSSVTLHDAADSATPLTASYQAGTSRGTGYSGQHTIANPGGRRRSPAGRSPARCRRARR